jgi:hypothetical protein
VRPPPASPAPPPPSSAGPPSLSIDVPPALTAEAEAFATPAPEGGTLLLETPGAATANPFAAPPSSSPDLSLQVGSGDEPPPPPPGRDAFGAGPDDEPGLELDTPVPPARPAPTVAPEPPRPTPAVSKRAEAPRPSSSLPGASALNLNRMSASSSGSGLSVDKEAAAEAYRVRCAKHGLYYDTRKASGCAKCLEKGRKLSAALEARAAGFKVADFGDNALKRAFVGLALALVIGFIPAAYHAFRVGQRDIHRLREEQEMLSRKPATEELLQRFEELNGTVDNATSRATRTTGILWMVMSGATLFGWYRVTT